GADMTLHGLQQREVGELGPGWVAERAGLSRRFPSLFLHRPIACRAEGIRQAVDLAAERLELVAGPDVQAMRGVDGGHQLGAAPELFDGPDDRVTNAAGDHDQIPHHGAEPDEHSGQQAAGILEEPAPIKEYQHETGDHRGRDEEAQHRQGQLPLEAHQVTCAVWKRSSRWRWTQAMVLNASFRSRRSAFPSVCGSMKLSGATWASRHASWRWSRRRAMTS